MGRFLLHMVLKKLLSRLSVISWSCPPPLLPLHYSSSYSFVCLVFGQDQVARSLPSQNAKSRSVISWSCPPPLLPLTSAPRRDRARLLFCVWVRLRVSAPAACLPAWSVPLPLSLSFCLSVCLFVCLSSSLSAAFAVVVVARVSFAYRAHCFYVTNFIISVRLLKCP